MVLRICPLAHLGIVIAFVIATAIAAPMNDAAVPLKLAKTADYMIECLDISANWLYRGFFKHDGFEKDHYYQHEPIEDGNAHFFVERSSEATGTRHGFIIDDGFNRLSYGIRAEREVTNVVAILPSHGRLKFNPDPSETLTCNTNVIQVLAANVLHRIECTNTTSGLAHGWYADLVAPKILKYITIHPDERCLVHELIKMENSIVEVSHLGGKPFVFATTKKGNVIVYGGTIGPIHDGYAELAFSHEAVFGIVFDGAPSRGYNSVFIDKTPSSPLIGVKRYYQAKDSDIVEFTIAPATKGRNVLLQVTKNGTGEWDLADGLLLGPKAYNHGNLSFYLLKEKDSNRTINDTLLHSSDGVTVSDIYILEDTYTGSKIIEWSRNKIPLEEPDGLELSGPAFPKAYWFYKHDQTECQDWLSNSGENTDLIQQCTRFLMQSNGKSAIVAQCCNLGNFKYAIYTRRNTDQKVTPYAILFTETGVTMVPYTK